MVEGGWVNELCAPRLAPSKKRDQKGTVPELHGNNVFVQFLICYFDIQTCKCCVRTFSWLQVMSRSLPLICVYIELSIISLTTSSMVNFSWMKFDTNHTVHCSCLPFSFLNKCCQQDIKRWQWDVGIIDDIIHCLRAFKRLLQTSLLLVHTTAKVRLIFAHNLAKIISLIPLDHLEISNFLLWSNMSSITLWLHYHCTKLRSCQSPRDLHAKDGYEWPPQSTRYERAAKRGCLVVARTNSRLL